MYYFEFVITKYYFIHQFIPLLLAHRFYSAVSLVTFKRFKLHFALKEMSQFKWIRELINTSTKKETKFRLQPFNVQS